MSWAVSNSDWLSCHHLSHLQPAVPSQPVGISAHVSMHRDLQPQNVEVVLFWVSAQHLQCFLESTSEGMSILGDVTIVPESPEGK